MFAFVRPGVAPAVSLFLALLTVLALGGADAARAQTVTLALSEASIAEDGGTSTVTATVAPASATPFTVEISTAVTAGESFPEGRVTVSGTTLSFAANATTSTGPVTITAIDNDGHTVQRRGGVRVTVSGAVTGGTGVTGPDDVTLTVVEDDGIGSSTDRTRPEQVRGSSTVNGNRAVLVFSEALNPGITPDKTAFFLRVVGEEDEKRPRTVEVMGAQVILTLEDPVEAGISAAVRYKPFTDVNADIDLTLALQDPAGNPVYRIITIPLVNNTPPRVEFVLTPPSIDENGGETVVTATAPRASSTPFEVTVAVAPVAPAMAGDFTVSGTTLSFAANATESTGEVTITAVDDDALEGDLQVTVSGTVAGTMDLRAPFDATLTILDDEAAGFGKTASIQRAWLARFGRGAAEAVLEGVSGRLTAPRGTGLRGKLAGLAFHGATPPPDRPRYLPGDAAASNPFRSRRVAERDMLTGTAFAFTGGTDGGGSLALWGQGGYSAFEGIDGAIRLDGTVTAATLGADYSAGRWLAGLALSHSRGEGSYRSDREKGDLETSVTGVYPYARYAVTERLSLWVAAGHGQGTLRAQRAALVRQPAVEVDMSLSMAAGGVRGVLLKRPDGLRLATQADMLYLRTASEPAAGLQGAEADVDRLRFGLEGAWVRTFDGGATLTPSFEIGGRHDDGDAETGFGVDAGGGIAWADPGSGLRLSLDARGLLAHEAAGFREWGVSGALHYDPNPVSGRGLSLALAPSWGAASTGGADALIGRESLAWMSREGTRPADARLRAELAYGFPAFGGRFTGTPYLGFGLTQAGRDFRIGWRLAAARRDDVDMTLGLEAARREYAVAGPEHRASLRFGLRW